MFSSATAATSLSVRFRQPPARASSAVCQAGLGSNSEQPDPVPAHALSAQPRAVPGARSRVVPPTDVTNCDEAGKLAPKPSSPAATVMTTPGWLKYWSLAEEP